MPGLYPLKLEQICLAQESKRLSVLKYRAQSSTQADVIRSEVELARINVQLKSLQSRIKASEAMLNVCLSSQANLPIPELVFNVESLNLNDSQTVLSIALSKRPEIAAARVTFNTIFSPKLALYSVKSKTDNK